MIKEVQGAEIRKKRGATSGGAPVDSGWPRDAKERGDFLHPPRMFPEGARQWREELVAVVLEHRKAFGRLPPELTKETVREVVDEGLGHLREILRFLQLTYRHESGHHPVTPTEVRRVLGRIGPFDVLEPRLDALKAVAGRDLESLVPPAIMERLAGLLTSHGQGPCTPRSPDCGKCELRRLCADFRTREAARAEQEGRPTVVDFFCGAGGLSEGFSRAGFRVVGAVDLDPVALKTLWFNKPWLRREQAISRDIWKLEATELRKVMGVKRPDVVLGAPPCQGFSSAGFRGKASKTGFLAMGDKRNFLFERLIDLAEVLEPRLFLMENVPGMGTARKDDATFLDAAAARLKRAGYEPSIWELNATAFGVPQDRTRCFLAGARIGSPRPALPAGDYQSIRGATDVDALPVMTLDEALLGLPKRAAGEGSAVEVWDRAATPLDEKRSRRYLGKFRLLDDSAFIFNHHVRYHNERDLELYALLKPGQNSVTVVEEYRRDDLMRYRTDVFDDKYSRLRGDRPGKTIVSHLAKDGNGYIHPREIRSISIREAARVQSFPDNYVFCGSPSDQWVQVGNAVPPVMAEAIARTFMRVLQGGKK